MIEVRELTKRYGDRVAVDSISFSAERGQILGFLVRTARKDDHDAHADGLPAPLERERPGRRVRRLQRVVRGATADRLSPREPSLYADMTVRSYLGFVARLKG
jgi:ABC-2 type transport system ATP-binding protein